VQIGTENVLRHFDELIVHTQAGLQRLRSYGLPEAHIHQIPHGPLGPAGLARTDQPDRAGAGLAVLLSGPPGTGKTMVAALLAHALDLDLYQVDLSKIVSKWVGETEKNLETAFSEAEDSHSILFFDEADALFGKRSSGDSGSGVERYSNLEVAYLLQRLEDHPGLVILASNLREEIDPAFVRRFHVILHFPRPSPEERARIWRVALPPEAPLGADVNLPSLAKLDLTGAGIVGTARTAALLAADEGADAIQMRHFVQAMRRQFQREARLLTNLDLGKYAHLLPGN